MVIYNKSFMAVTSIKTGTKRLILVPRDLPRTINDIMLQAKKKMNRNGRAGENHQKQQKSYYPCRESQNK
jgi:hypothetical protein